MDQKRAQLQTVCRLDVNAIAEVIASTQRASGEIPWHPNGKTDPWDHVEAAMGLTIAGHLPQARLAYIWLACRQLADGSWYAAYQDDNPLDTTRQTHFTAYIAVGLYHYFLATGDHGFVSQMWPTVRSAIEYCLGLQAPTGEFYWAVSPQGQLDAMALLTGCSSIYMSLKCALAIAYALRRQERGWAHAMHKLGAAICHSPYRFNMTKARYAMDWFYPVLAGAMRGKNAQQRIGRHWKKFVVEGLGVRCVCDQPWVTIAETAELVLALAAMGRADLAKIVFSWILDRRCENNAFWCGFTFPDMVVWPEGRTTWTNAVVLMAADALYQLTPACGLFSHRHWANLRL